MKSFGLKMCVAEGSCSIAKDTLNAAKLQGVDVVDGVLGSFYLEFGRSARSARIRLFLPIRCSFRARFPVLVVPLVFLRV